MKKSSNAWYSPAVMLMHVSPAAAPPPPSTPEDSASACVQDRRHGYPLTGGAAIYGNAVEERRAVAVDEINRQGRHPV